ncbi:hypothetical protein DCAR_0832316 [Daucus carota subsp. sativus]|uniref:Uncharacterized protein n=1 Tax=Daucus carota subsp. sativus TaxID=79200 RepID=A0A175YP08_DAUCS|nr:hypothetical protein DCAR_0832316 [Daucus carota subsp. sativus]
MVDARDLFRGTVYGKPTNQDTPRHYLSLNSKGMLAVVQGYCDSHKSIIFAIVHHFLIFFRLRLDPDFVENLAEERHGDILGHLLYAAKLAAEKEGIVDGFRILSNNGPAAACMQVDTTYKPQLPSLNSYS